MNDTGVNQFSNEEPLRECMYCDVKKTGRGMTNHVRWKSDAKHGERDDIPDDFDIKKCEQIGTENVSVSRQSEVPQHSRYICDYCGHSAKGKRGLGVHIARSDDSLHEIADKEDVDFDRHHCFPATDDKVIRIPSIAYQEVFSLTEEEESDGWELVVDESVTSDIAPTKTVLLHQHGEEMWEYVQRGERISPVEAHSIFERLIRRLPEETND